jgi:Ca2+-binding RTX toxin-like protein
MPDTTAPHGTLTVFSTAITNRYGLSDVGSFASPTFADIDADGDLDVFIGNNAGNTLVYLNTGSATSPAFAAPVTNPYGLGDVGSYANPTLADIDGDGDLDVFVGNQAGNTLVYLNTGSATSPAFAAPSTNPYGLGNVGFYASPAFADIDGDGDLDAFIGYGDGNTLVYLNTGSTTSPAFAVSSTNPYGLGDVGLSANPTFADIDGDGDLDAFIGNHFGNTQVYLNTGSATSPAFAVPSTNPYGLGNVDFFAHPALADIDADGDVDAFIGNFPGNTQFFLNTSSFVAPVTSSTANGSYGIGSVITLNVAFSENVLVAGGTPTLLLETGSVDRLAAYSGGSGTSMLTFTYTVQAGDTSSDLDFSSTSALALNGATIRDAAGNDAILTLATPGAAGSLAANAALVIDWTRDALVGTAGADTLNGGLGADTMSGGDGDDRYYVDNTGDVVIETNAASAGGTDTVYSSLAAYTLTANVEHGVVTRSGAASLTGNSRANALDGGAGADTLNGGLGADTMTGGDGDDRYYVDNAGDVVIETNAASAGGTDTVYSALGAYTLTSHVEYGILQASGAADLTGNALANRLYAGRGDNVLDGAGGTDRVLYSLATAGVTVSLAASGAQNTGGSGWDTLISIEQLIGSDHADTLTGNAGGNVLGGGADNDTLDGGLGADTMTGGDGSDRYYVDNTGDVVSETNAVTATGGTDTAYSALSAYTLTANVEYGIVQASGAADLTGNALANRLYAGRGDNVLDGADGTDRVLYASATTGVTVSLAASGAQNTGGSGWDTLVSIEQLIGSDYADTLTGNAGGNVLGGGAGNDTLEGGAGNDILTGSTGAEVFRFGSASGQDGISDFTLSQGDRIRLQTGLNGSTIIDGASALAHVSDVSGHAVLDLGGGNTVTLTGVLTADLSAADFLFF